MNRHAFTLLELMMVLTITALLAGAATVRLASTLRRQTLASAIDMAVAFDETVRVRSERSRQAVAAEFNLSNQVALIREGERVMVRRAFGGAVRIAGIITALGGRRAEGSLTLSCARGGRMAAYALELEDRGGERRWLVFASLTGAWRDVGTSAEAEALLADERTGPDAR